MKNRLWDKVEDLFFPFKCPGCGEKTDREDGVLCVRCLVEYERLKYSPCKRCGKPAWRCQCPPKFSAKGVSSYVSVFPYDKTSPGGRLVLLLKDRKNRRAIELLGRDMAYGLTKNCSIEENSLICYVPRDRRTYLEKGVDQAKELAKEVAKLCNLPLVQTLEHRKTGKEQKELDAVQRRENARAGYALLKRCPELSHQQVILVDDVLTTGSTMSACATLLKERGAGQIICLTAAKTAFGARL